MSDPKHTSLEHTPSATHFLHVIKEVKSNHMTLPGKRESIKNLKYALEKCDSKQLHVMAEVFGLKTDNESDNRLRLNILDHLQFLIYGHAIQSWNAAALWALLLVLFYIFSALAGWSAQEGDHDTRWELTKKLNIATNILLIIVYIFGISLTTKFFIRFVKSWDVRRTLQKHLDGMKDVLKSPSPAMIINQLQPQPKPKTPKSKTLKPKSPKPPKVPKENTPKGKTPKPKSPKGKTPKPKTPKQKTPKSKTPKLKTPQQDEKK
jgi:hypothetical protein